MRVGEVKSDISFRAKNVTLYSDFDGTFLQTYSDGNYYKAFDDFRNERNGKFKFFITTGRTLEVPRGKGFLNEYTKLRAQHTRFPRMEGVITGNGGDVFSISKNGDVDRSPMLDKRFAVEERTGWNIDRVKQGIQDISERLQVPIQLDNKKGFHRLNLYVLDDQHVENFCTEVEKYFSANNINAEAKITTKDGNPVIKTAPLISGRRIHKDFDVKQALNMAIKENDFVVVAGNAKNDRGQPSIDKVEKIPTKGLPDMIEQIRKLPVGVIYVNSASGDSNKMLELRAFMEEQKKLFPEKVMIIEESKKGENNFVEACRNLVDNHFGKEIKATMSQAKEVQYKGQNWKATFAVLGALLLANIGIYTLQYAKILSHNKKD